MSGQESFGATVCGWDPLDPEFIAEPYPMFRRLRDQGPLLWHEQLQSWVATDFKTCEHVLRNWQLFASNFEWNGEKLSDSELSIQTLDPPEHTAIHDLLVRAFKMQNTASFVASIRSSVHETMEPLLRSSECSDLVSDFAVPVAVEASLNLLGAPADDGDLLTDFLALSGKVVASMNAGLCPETAESGTQARQQLSETLAAWLDDAAPTSGLIHAIKEQGIPSVVPRHLLVNSLRVIFLAGINSTSRLIGLATLALLGNQQAERQLRVCSDISKAAHELIRYDTPVQAQSRMCIGDTNVAGKSLRAGDVIVALLGSANRDPRQFVEPERVMIHRTPNSHLGFGRGVHACLGAWVAVTVLTEVIRAIWHGGIIVDPVDEPCFDANPTLRGLRRFLVCLRSRPT